MKSRAPNIVCSGQGINLLAMLSILRRRRREHNVSPKGDGGGSEKGDFWWGWGVVPTGGVGLRHGYNKAVFETISK
jgi:hypothetical protein